MGNHTTSRPTTDTPPRVIAEPADGDCAMACIERIEAYCRGFANFPERGL